MQKILYIPIDITLDNPVECKKLIKRGDTLTLQIKVFNNGVLADLSGQSIDLILKKSDNTLIEKTIDTSNVANGVITAIPGQQATLMQGIVSGEVQIYTNNTLSSTNTFTFNVDASLADDVLEISKDDIQVLADLRNLINNGQIALNKYNDCVLAIGNSVEALEALANIKSYINTNLPVLENANAQAVVNIANETTQNTQANKNISDLTAVNNTASELKSGLETDINTGNTLKAALEADITNGNTLKNSIENDIQTGNTLKSDLENTISTGDTLKTNLDNANTQATANINALDQLGDVTQIAQNVTDLKNEVQTARGSEANLGTRLNKFDTSLSEITQDIAQLSNPNLLINGDFQVWQRGTSFSPLASGGIYSVDRWISYMETANNLKASKVSNGLKIQKVSSPISSIYQNIEHILPIGTKLTLSAKVDGVVKSITGLLATTKVAFICNNIEISFSGNGTSTFTVSLTPQDITEHIIEWVKLELGPFATPFIPRLYGEELALCKRYYEIIEQLNVFCPNITTATLNGAFSEKRVAPTLKLLTTSFTIWCQNNPAFITSSNSVLGNYQLSTRGISYADISGFTALSTNNIYKLANIAPLLSADAEIY